MHEVLSRWGRWAASDERCAQVDWPRRSMVFKYQPVSLDNACSDNDGLAIDACVAQLARVHPRDDVIILKMRFVECAPTRFIAKTLGITRTSVSASLRSSEAFLEGCMISQALVLDMDLLVVKPCCV